MVRGYVRANLGDAHRRAKTRRYLAAQLDPSNNRSTLEAVEGLRRFDHPTLLLWAKEDPHFGPQWAERLARDLPNARLELLSSGHLLMEEQPEQYAKMVSDFVGQA